MLPLSSCKIIFFRKLPTRLFSFLLFIEMYMARHFVGHFVPLNIVPFMDGSTWEKYGSFLNSFHPEIKRLKPRLERIKNKIGR